MIYETVLDKYKYTSRQWGIGDDLYKFHQSKITSLKKEDTLTAPMLANACRWAPAAGSPGVPSLTKSLVHVLDAGATWPPGRLPPATWACRPGEPAATRASRLPWQLPEYQEKGWFVTEVI